jgi:hypothetical protein
MVALFSARLWAYVITDARFVLSLAPLLLLHPLTMVRRRHHQRSQDPTDHGNVDRWKAIAA